MSETTADLLGIGEGFRVWAVGGTTAVTSLLRPLPEGVEVFDHDADDLDATVLLADDLDVLTDQLDDALPRLSTVPLVWACFPMATVSPEAVAEAVHDHGWGATAPLLLDETHAAMRLAQD